MSEKNPEEFNHQVKGEPHFKNKAALNEKEQLQNLKNENKLAAHHTDTEPRPDVIATYQNSHINYSTLYKKLAQ